MNSRFALAAFFFFCISFMALGQDNQYLRCRLIDHETQKPIPFVTIVIPQKKLGIIANADGDFRIRRTSVSGNDSVVFTCIGYQKRLC